MNFLEGLKSIDIEIDGERIEIPDSLIAKTIKIFRERILVFFEKEVLPEDVIHSLFRIQLIVFLIDIYYESHWDFEVSQILPLWDKISDSMMELGLRDAEIRVLLEDIRAYEKIEQDMRQGKTVDSFPIKDFYYLKSCDVRLQRNLAQFVQKRSVSPSNADQIDFDILGEILDDLDDLGEDDAEGIYNGNRLLCSVRKDRLKTIGEYKAYLLSFMNDGKSVRVKTMATQILEKLEQL